MYYDFYHFTENPFSVTADPSFFFSSSSHSEAIANLKFGIEQRKGIIVITGEIGTGKTTLCRTLLKRLNKKIKFAFVLNPNFSDLQLLQVIAHDLGINAKEKNKFELINVLNDFLITQTNSGYNVVIMIDEAQNLGVSQLEEVRLLSNLETEKEKLLQIVLVGQPELNEKLQLPELRQLRQRIAVHYHIQALEKGDVQRYIHHRIEKAAANRTALQKLIFTEQAIDAIHHYTQGSPRAINLLCDRALLAGFVAETFWIDKSIIDTCAKEIMYCEHHL